MGAVKFKDMPYRRPDIEAVKADYEKATKALREADSYEEARGAFYAQQEIERKLITMETLASIRHSIDTRDEFYDAEEHFWNETAPELQASKDAWIQAMLETPYREQFSGEYGSVTFVNAELAKKAFAPELIPDLKEEAELCTEYMKVIASAQIPFMGKTYTLSQLTPWKNDPDDEVRLAAWKAEGTWYKEHQETLDTLYDQLVKVRDRMGRTLGYENYTPLGYLRMQRNCYTKEDVEAFRTAVRTYLVPIAEDIYRANAERLGLSYPLSFADAQLEFRSGNPKPQGDAEDVLRAGDKFYAELSEETGAFFKMMRERELLDVLSTEGKEAGGYCTAIPEYGVPFIFANFNGTQHDVEVVTHEAGHAFAGYLNADRVPMDNAWPSMEGCEVHSMSMEFFAEPWAEDFFGEDARKFRYSHLAGALTFIPYGTMVDHFQHIVYEKPEMTPAERHATWKELLGIYMPWLRLDGEIPFYADGEGWQRQQHIYRSPFYYIDYCLAQTVALEFWAMMQKDFKDAWQHYMTYTALGGSKTFTELLKDAGLASPFEEETLRGVAETAKAYLASYDLGGIV